MLLKNQNSLFKGLKSLYTAIIPDSVKAMPMVVRMKGKFLGHDLIYDSEYFRMVDIIAVRNATVMADSIMNEFGPSTLIDVGCGSGALLHELRDRGCEVAGLEYADAALEYCKSRQLNVEKFDLEKDGFAKDQMFDVVVSIEVAEHLPAAFADRYVRLLAQLSSTVVFTAAPLGQGGRDHVNEQPPEYWISKFRENQFEFLEEATTRWSDDWKRSGQIDDWYHRNVMLFQRA